MCTGGTSATHIGALPNQPPVGNQSGDAPVTTGPADRDGRTDPRTE